MPHSTEFPYFVPRPTAPHVHRNNLRDEAHREENVLRNFFLWSVSLEKELTYWINPEGSKGPLAKPVMYWYPRAKAQAILEEMNDSPDIVAYRLIDEGLKCFSDFAANDFKRTVEQVFSPKSPPR